MGLQTPFKASSNLFHCGTELKPRWDCNWSYDQRRN